MRNGLRAWDADTHVNPAADVLDRYVDPGFRPRLAELAPHRVAWGKMIGGAHDTFTGRGTHWMGSKQPRMGVQDDQAENRVKDMDDEGADAHFMVPTLW